MKFISEISVTEVQSVGDDAAIVAAARVSTLGAVSLEQSSEKTSEHAGLINYLMKHRHGCFDDETDVLTESGWLNWKHVVGNERFVTLNMQTNEIELQKAERVVHKKADGAMIRIKNGTSVDLLVTADHNMLASPRISSGESEYGLYPARQFLERSHRIKITGGKWSGKLSANEDAMLAGFIAADGHVGTSVEFRLRKSRKIEWLMSRADLNINGDKYTLKNISRQLREWAKSTYTASGDRCFPRDILKRGSSETIRAMLEGYLAGDGSVSKSGKVTCSTVSEQLAADIQEAALKAGYAAVIGSPDIARKGSFGNKPLHRITIYRTRNVEPKIGWTRSDREKQVRVVSDYSGQIHCVTVKNGTLYVRRNGKPCWCGNTPFEHGAITFLVHAPIFVWREWHRHRIGFCLAGDTEIWTESIGLNHGRTLRKRRIKDLCDVWNNGVKDSLGRTRFLPSVKNQRLRVLNEDTGFFELGGIEDVFESGVKECLLVETEHKKGWSLRCTADHQILTSEGWMRAGDLTGSEWIAVSGKKSAFEHRQIPPSLRSGIGVWTSMQRKSMIFERLRRKPYVISEEMTYDITMKAPWHNFVANGIVVHNSYNEESGRYKQLEPVFYVPPRDRPMMKVDGWKPGRPKFLHCESESVYWQLVDNLTHSYKVAYELYEANLALGIDPGLARDCLPVGIYSSCWVTCNPRSLMAFLSLRTHDQTAKAVSYPLYEIEVAARAVEAIFAERWPITYKAFVEQGRMGP